MYRLNFLRNLRQIILFIFVSVILLCFARFIFLFKIAELNEVLAYKNDLLPAFITGLRFDLKVSVIGFMPLFLLGCFCATNANREQTFISISKYYSAVIYFLVITVSISNYFFYKTYGNFFDVFMFGFIDDDTQAVALSIWQDYPVIQSLVFAAVCIFIINFIIKKCSRDVDPQQTPPSTKKVSIIAFASVLVFFVLARGALGSFPLGRYDANISKFIPINKVTPNAFMAMDWARKDYKNDINLKPVDEDELQEQMVKVIGQPTPVYHTPENAYLKDNKPNVFLVLMESMGNNYLVDDNSKTNDLLGALRPHLKEDFYFNRFQAGTSGTWTSIMMMLTQTNHASISQSSYKNKKMASLATIPYKKAGYEVSFIYAGDGGWRNSADYLRNQGFDHFYDEASILAQFPEAKATKSEWGLADEYAFKFAQHVLETAKKPQMIFMMSITNHPPFSLPNTYSPKPVALTERLKNNISNSPEEALISEKTYQYASDSLGKFIAQIKASPLKENTVIAASGDHHMRNINMDLKNEYAITYGVPFYLYIPKPILEHTEYKFDQKRIGSHRDIFPTLYNYSLSDADYITLGGQNLLDTNGVDNIGYNETHLVTENGSYSKDRPQDLYQWDTDLVHTVPTPVVNDNPNFLKDYDKLQDMYTRYLVNDETN
ncbi:MAG: LTA synthase family protein [Vibrio sp.]